MRRQEMCHVRTLRLSQRGRELRSSTPGRGSQTNVRSRARESKVTSKASDLHSGVADDVAEATGPTSSCGRTPQRLPEGVWGARHGPGTLRQRFVAMTPGRP